MVVTQKQFDTADMQIQAAYPAYTKYIHPDVFVVTTTFAASSAAYQGVAASITVDGTSATSQNIPQSQVQLITDLYTRTTSDTATDAFPVFYKNGSKQLARTAPQQTQLVTNQTRPGLPAPLIYEPNAKLTINEEPVAISATTVTTNTAFLTVITYDSSFG